MRKLLTGLPSPGQLALPLVGVVLIVVFTILAPSEFLTTGNFVAMFVSSAPTLVLALAVTTTLRSGDFDLSVSSNMIVCAAAVALLVQAHHWPLGSVLAVGLSVGLGIGLVNSIIVVLWNLDGFISTLGSMTAVVGLGYAITGGNVVYGLTGSLVSIERSKLFGIPLAVVYGWILAIILIYVFERTGVGRLWLFIGGNRDAALLLGLPVRRLRVIAYLVGGLLSGVAGIILAGSLGSVDVSSSGQYLLQPFVAAFLGTAAIKIGRFNILGTIVALYVLAIGESGLVLLGAPVWISNVFDGLTLIVALGFSAVVQRRLFAAAKFHWLLTVLRHPVKPGMSELVRDDSVTASRQ
jgi:ribose transport system permease protein